MVGYAAAVQWDARGRGVGGGRARRGQYTYSVVETTRKMVRSDVEEVKPTPGTQEADIRQHIKARNPQEGETEPRAMTIMSYDRRSSRAGIRVLLYEREKQRKGLF